MTTYNKNGPKENGKAKIAQSTNSRLKRFLAGALLLTAVAGGISAYKRSSKPKTVAVEKEEISHKSRVEVIQKLRQLNDVTEVKEKTEEKEQKEVRVTKTFVKPTKNLFEEITTAAKGRVEVPLVNAGGQNWEAFQMFNTDVSSFKISEKGFEFVNYPLGVANKVFFMVRNNEQFSDFILNVDIQYTDMRNEECRPYLAFGVTDGTHMLNKGDYKPGDLLSSDNGVVVSRWSCATEEGIKKQYRLLIKENGERKDVDEKGMSVIPVMSLSLQESVVYYTQLLKVGDKILFAVYATKEDRVKREKPLDLVVVEGVDPKNLNQFGIGAIDPSDSTRRTNGVISNVEILRLD
ncbi:MAG: hypothetical protein AABX38_00065 [Candidatus Micrarchaeota archaeon]